MTLKALLFTVLTVVAGLLITWSSTCGGEYVGTALAVSFVFWALTGLDLI